MIIKKIGPNKQSYKQKVNKPSNNKNAAIKRERQYNKKFSCTLFLYKSFPYLSCIVSRVFFLGR